jgi:bacterioferritin-associated ferredoxin
MTIKISRPSGRVGVIMYVCICRAITLSRLQALVGSGIDTLDGVERACGAGGDCGTCQEDIRRVLSAERRLPQSEAA